MGEKIKPIYTTDFPLPPEGWGIWMVEKADVTTIPEDQVKATKSGIKNDKNYVLGFKGQGQAENGDIDGMSHNEFIPFFSDKEFGLAKLYGMMVTAGVIKDAGEVDSDTMRKDKFQTTFKMKMPKTVIGGRIKYSPNPNNKLRPYANIVEWESAAATLARLQELHKNAPAGGAGTGATTGAGVAGTQQPPPPPPGPAEEPDPFADVK